ncbi:MAG: DNA topoisomerase (ATP-hydrolyzing) subunit A [Spirochaetales bacterium]|nr:DNA topoisomerase (ATP-hydrolyzing) subunit A [Spirochaetales bacterium]
MAENIGKVIPIAIEDEVKESYMNYAMSVIVSRALPDVKDGLKPVHRRILYAMNEMGLRHERPYKKTARIVGDVLGKYHPHGDQSVYDALVRMAQDFSLRYPLIDGQGNFGSIDGDSPAAMRYTEARLAGIANEVLRDINKETVNFGPNYDGSMQEPLVLPSALPVLLINGSSGIAVGMATNLAPHNLKEVAKAIIAQIDNPEITTKELMHYIKGPDFPTGGIIFGKSGIRDAYSTGRGKIVVRARVVLETVKSGKEIIVVNELPYQVNKANLIIKIADLVREGRIEGISDLRDESDRHGMRIVIELKRGIKPRLILNQLFTHTSLQVNFAVNNLALVDGLPKVLKLKELVGLFIKHREEVITRRAKYDLKKAEERAHILKGLVIALENIDEVVAIIKKSRNVETARNNLMKRFKLSEIQAQAILDMRLQKLTSLETKKIEEELKAILAQIKYLKELLASEEKILNIVKKETEEIAKKYGDERRTEILNEEVEEINIEDLIAKEDMVILISHNNLIKRIPVSAYRSQNRGGRGSSAVNLRTGDFIEKIFIASTHDYILFITSEGLCYWLKVYEIPEGSRASRGQSIKTLLSISNNEEITAVESLSEFSDKTFLFMATNKGTVKRVTSKDFRNARARGIRAIRLDKNERLISAKLTSGEKDVVLVTRRGNALRFKESKIRVMGRASHGVQGIKLINNDELAGIVIIEEKEKLFVISQNGYGKRIKYDLFTPHGRATRGQICYKVNDKSGEIAGVLSVKKNDDIVCITSQGVAIKISQKRIPSQGKSALGVKIVNINKPDIVVGVARAEKDT